jgi:DNA-binding beta-propeller fold protein YncE
MLRDRLLHSAWLASICTSALAACIATAAPPARAETCAGSNGHECSYSSVQIVGPRAESILRFPEAVAVDTQGNVYVADQLSYVVQKFTAAGAFETQWGSYGGGHGQFGPIGGLATDAAGNVYVLDSSHNRIEKFNPSGEFITQWGHGGGELGEFDFGSSQNYTQPPGGGIAVAGSYVYVADSGNNRIERFNLQGGEPLAWGTHGSLPGEFSYPRGVAANEGEVLIGDTDNHRIEKFSPAGAYEGEAGSVGSGLHEFGYPYGVALDAAGDVYVADDSNDRVVKLSPQLAFLGAWGGFGSKPAQLAFPRALASDPAGDTYVADTANDRIEVFDAEGNYLRTLGASARTPGVLTAPRGLAVDPTGRLLVSDAIDNRVELFAAGSDTYEGQWTAAGGFASGFNAPAGIGVDGRGAVYVADEGNARVVRLWGDGTYLGEVGGPADLGGAGLHNAGSVAVSQGPDETYVADTAHNRVLVYGPEGTLRAKWGANEGDGAAGSGTGQLDRPSAVALDGAGDAYVADTDNNRVVEFSPTGSVIAQWGSRGTGAGHFRSPTGIAVDAAGRVYVVDSENDRVQVFGSGGQFLYSWGVRGIAPGEFAQPSAIAIDCNGDAYVADTDNNRVQRFNLVAPAATGCVPAATWPPPLNVPPVLHVTLLRTRSVLARHALALSVSCQRGCRIYVTGTLSPLVRHAKAVPLEAVARALPKALAGHVRLQVGTRTLRRLQRELARHRTMLAHVRIVAAGPTGLRTTVTETYLVTR